MRNRKEENLMQALDQRIRIVVEQVLSKMLTQGTPTARAETFLVRPSTNGANHKGSVGPRKRGRGRPPKVRQQDISGKIVKTTSTLQGSVIYTDNEKYLRRRDGSVIKLSHVKGSVEPARAMGYSSAQYQLARRHHWPMPCPMDFELPPKDPRGRRPKSAKQ